MAPVAPDTRRIFSVLFLAEKEALKWLKQKAAGTEWWVSIAWR